MAGFHLASAQNAHIYKQNEISPKLNLNKTLRVDYIFSGDANVQEISPSTFYSFDGWAGKRHHLDSIPLAGNGQIVMKDKQTEKVLYAQSFSTLFQEWLNTEEATQTRKAFENVFLLPMPLDSVLVEITLKGNHDKTICSYSHPLNPKDILIRPLQTDTTLNARFIMNNGSPEDCIDIIILAEGYTREEQEHFFEKATEATDAIFRHEPFQTYRNRFNVVAVALSSDDTGVSTPRNNDWRNTALDSHFDTFYSDRYLTTLSLQKMHNLIAGFPYEHIIILANTDEYGGGGIYNSYVLSMTEHKMFQPVVVHEFGHSFAGLADEYFYDDQFQEYYYPDTEPWEQNITTLRNFDGKWKDMLPDSTLKNIPTPLQKDNLFQIGVYEGGGYQSKGVYRAFQECRMKINEWPEFCQVCQRAISRLIQFYTE